MPAVLDRPPVLDRPAVEETIDVPPVTRTRERRAWYRYLFPWVKTAIGGPVADDDLLVVNSTDEAWVLSRGYRGLGTMPPHDQQVVSVVRSGFLSARQPGTSAGTGPLTLALTPAVRAVEISCIILQETPLYHLTAIERPDARSSRSLP